MMKNKKSKIKNWKMPSSKNWGQGNCRRKKQKRKKIRMMKEKIKKIINRMKRRKKNKNWRVKVVNKNSH